MIKRLLVIVICLGMVLGLKGCGGSGGSSVRPSEETPSLSRPAVGGSTAEHTDESLPPDNSTESQVEGSSQAPASTGESDSQIKEEIDPDSTTIPEISIDFEEVSLEWRDFEGYRFSSTYGISPWFRDTETDLLKAAWKQMGADLSLIPTLMLPGQKMTVDGLTYQHQADEVIFAAGYLEVDNITEGFDISAENTKTTS